MFVMRRYKKVNQQRIPDEIVQKRFQCYITREEGLKVDWENKDSSTILQILCHIAHKGSARACAVQAAAGYPNLVKGNAAHAARTKARDATLSEKELARRMKHRQRAARANKRRRAQKITQ